MSEFDFTEELPDVKWIVKNLIPAGQFCLMLAQAGVGKSLVVEQLAVCVCFGLPFCGFETVEGNVLIIDQDTPTDRLKARLKKFGVGLKSEKKHMLFVESMQGFSFSNKEKLFDFINDLPTVKLIIIDSLHSICGRLNPNHTMDMGILAKLKETCLKPDKTIIINHHITEKTVYPVHTLMSDDTHKMAMGNSAILQQADSYYIVGASAENGITEKLYIRPVAKRLSIPTKPMVLQMLQVEDSGERLEFGGYYEPDFDAAENDIMILFREQNTIRTVKEVYEALGHQYGENKVRTALANLESRGYLFLSRHQHDLFKYRLP